MNASGPPGTPMVSEIRFGDTNNGWAYGGKSLRDQRRRHFVVAVTSVPGDGR